VAAPDGRWRAFPGIERVLQGLGKTHVLLLVKVAVDKKNALQEALAERVKAEGIVEEDAAVSAGLLLGRLLGVEQ